MDTPNPKRLAIAPNLNQTDFDSIISSFLLLPDSPTTSTGCSLDRVLAQVLSSASEASGDDSLQDRLIDRSRKLSLLLLKSTERFSRERAKLYNYKSWSLPLEVTIKVFSMLDTKSLMRAAACCTMFGKCAGDPLCYSHVDLMIRPKRRKRFNEENVSFCSKKQEKEEIVSRMIDKAGTELRSITLGCVDHQASPSITSSCFDSLSRNGNLLRSLHLYNLAPMATKSLCNVLSVCPNLTDLKIVNFQKKYLLRQVVKTLSSKPRLMIDNLFLENHIDCTASGISNSTVEAFVTACPNLTSLTLIGFQLKEKIARNLVEGFCKLKYLNLSRTPEICGRFLRDSRNSCDSPLRTLILRDCPSLHKDEITQFLNSLIKGDFRFIRHIDVSNERGLINNGGSGFSIPRILLEKLKEEREDVTFVANST